MTLTKDDDLKAAVERLPTKALSIRQPWAWLIVNGHKDIENRDWRTNYRGPVLIHAGKKADPVALSRLAEARHPVTGLQLPLPDYPVELPLGGIVGVAEIVDCVEVSASPWFVGRFGFVIRNARPLPFLTMHGMLGFFVADRYADVMAGALLPPAGDQGR